jgi:hypothetical protein
MDRCGDGQVIRRALLVLALLAAPMAVEATSCTKGTDCFCDCVTGADRGDGFKNDACQSKGTYVGTSSFNPQGSATTLVCEDFEAPTLHPTNTSGTGNGAPYYGPWWDTTGGSAGDRGFNSYWRRNYGNGVNNMIWSNGQPSSPTHGGACAFPACTGLKPWLAGDAANGNSLTPGMAFLRTGDFDDEISTLTDPANAAGGGSGAFDGAVSLAHRNPSGAGNVKGIAGAKNFGAQQTFGVTMAMAFPMNLTNAGTVVHNAWKFNEWGRNGEAGGAGMVGFGYTSYGSYFPFYGFLLHRSSGGFTVAQCNTAKAAATIAAGRFTCSDLARTGAITSFTWFPTNYTHATHWPLGSWGCIRAYYQNLGDASSAWWIKFTGPDGTERTVVDISGMDTSGFRVGQTPKGISSLIWNNYANRNQTRNPATVTTFRYEDNVHVRAGMPVSCSQIGYGTTGRGSAKAVPATPTNGSAMLTP